MKRNAIAVALLTSVLMTACGGGGGSAADSSGATSPGTLNTSDGAGAAGSGDGGVNAAPTISSVTAPADNEQVSGIRVLTIEGENIGNAELLPASGATPQIGIFSVAADRRSATLSFDTAMVPNGPLTVRIAVWNALAGSAGATEAVAMPSRTWVFSNDPAPAGSDAGRAARCLQMGFPYTAYDPVDPVVCITATPTNTPVAQCTAFGTGYGSPQDLLEVLRNGTRVSKLYCEPGANNGVVNPGCVCLS